MIKLKILFGLLSLAFVICGCDETATESGEEKILTNFTEPFPKKGFDITRILGSELSLKEPNGSTSIFFLDHFRADRSTVIRDANGDTVYNGPVCRYRGLYFTTEMSEDPTFLISAFSVQDKVLKGFMQQKAMLKLFDDSFSFYFDKPSEKPPYLTKCSNAGITFLTEKKLLKNLFNQFLEKMPDQEIILENSNESELMEEKDSSSFLNDEPTEMTYVKSYGPNPVVDMLNIELNAKGRYTINITNLNGEVLDRLEEKTESFTIDFTSYSVGAYLLTISKGNKKVTDQIKIIKS